MHFELHEANNAKNSDQNDYEGDAHESAALVQLGHALIDPKDLVGFACWRNIEPLVIEESLLHLLLVLSAETAAHVLHKEAVVGANIELTDGILLAIHAAERDVRVLDLLLACALCQVRLP